ncbi:MAG: class I SAM-dependent methyltransferase [Deltaproteobacteria bacterium]|nr:MAG: class I SAM-dependent methyltransferase [Deltaproteobacteria bacterium]
MIDQPTSLGSLYEQPRLYDLLAPMLTEGDAELGFWRRACGGARSLLELGCGTGRLAIPLAAGGLEVTGLDAAPAMLAAGRDRAARVGAPVRFVLGDMAGFDLGERFDAVVVALNSLLHLHTRAALEGCLASVRAHLAPGGVFVLSVLSPDPRTLARHAHHRLPLMPEPVHDPEADRPLMVEETIAYDHATQRTRGKLHFSYPDARDFFVGGADLRVLWPLELEALLHYNGFEIVSRTGDFDGAPFDSRSHLQNVVCRP